jgi:hypothetical protein
MAFYVRLQPLWGHWSKSFCVDDDAQGQPLAVIWKLELEKRIIDREAWKSIGKKGFESPKFFGATSALSVGTAPLPPICGFSNRRSGPVFVSAPTRSSPCGKLSFFPGSIFLSLMTWAWVRPSKQD